MKPRFQLGERVKVEIQRIGSAEVLRLEGVISRVEDKEFAICSLNLESGPGEGEALAVALGY